MPGNPRPPSPPLTASATESAPSFPLNLPVDNLLETMQTIFLAVERTLEIVSTQTPRVAELRPATEASEEVSAFVHARYAINGLCLLDV